MARLKIIVTKPWVKFILQTIFYFLILLVLVYLYGYSGINNSKFIYNEF
ncbi:MULTISPECIES: teichoic acid D-Ala incorporation-associated protein DltX [Loigolactobacillus]|uniref:Cytochrome C554 n=1 Tax=Loigolactobacillus backii TaxID=375175 RepID=A0A192GYB5_9LACO|nr:MULTISPECIES: teichoic acid D-Ala incorporation-associated protein DltX [Loigolactobacillus]ANK58827.1 cytochrome C554 [Loigolactobacillus backii]ANK61509.1 cytochrome C554 [Loigolactobacillus backii]ANK63817.1 cytochrome C554 [Loigolactobacillus backii]ANK66265.1 cytochrome C554 [Loigolactobacillus backii]ANK69293.1 cytochrome C554 [Loigolactobacillus backii]